MNIADKRIVATLKKAKGILQKNGWCRGRLAQDAKGRVCFPTSRLAVSFCAVGAINRAGKGINRQSEDAIDAVDDELAKKEQMWSIIEYNDRSASSCAKGKRDIIRLFDRTIKRLSK